MPRDSELDRLGRAKDAAKQRHDEAYDRQQRLFEARKTAGQAQARAYERQDVAYKAQQRAWERLQHVRSANSPRIDSLNAQQERAYQNMSSAFAQASSAHDRRDGTAAASYAADGHRHKAESQGYVAERRRLVAEIRSASEELRNCQPAFQQAKAVFKTEQTRFQSAKAEHEKAVADFKQAKAAYLSARSAFQARLDRMREERKADSRSVAERAGVPYQYRDDVRISRQPDGTVNIYFGGIGKPDGLGHGHYVLDPSGKVTYRRDPFDPHGAHNFTEPTYWRKVKMSYDRDSGTYQTDNYIGIVGDTGQKTKAHIVVDAEGDIVFVRDIGGEILYSRKKGIGHLPDDLDWSR